MKAVLASKDASNLGQRSYSVRRIQDNLTIALFLAPAFLFFFAFQVYPIFQSIYYSFFNWKGFGPAVDFVGLDNYGRALTDPIFLKGVWNGILIVFFSLLVQLPLSMALALLVARNMPGRVFFRTVFFLPFVFSEVITAVIWASLFKPDPQIGLINALLVLIPGVQPQSFLGNPNTVLACIFVALSWKYFGFHMLLFLAGLQNIPQEIEEAARIDGANGIQLFGFITLPLLGVTLRTSIYLSVLGSLQQFGLVWIMSGGGPVNASETMATYMYRMAFVRFSLGYGAAVGILILLIALTFSLVYQYFVRLQDYLGGY